jgi:hypothetical protein
VGLSYTIHSGNWRIIEYRPAGGYVPVSLKGIFERVRQWKGDGRKINGIAFYMLFQRKIRFTKAEKYSKETPIE